MTRILRITISFVLVIAVGVLGAVTSVRALAEGVGGLTGAASFDRGPEIILPELAQTSRLFDRDGNPIGEIYRAENREEVALGQVSEQMIAAVLAVEDDNFYEHNGINVGAILRAFKANSDAGRTVQGGSTITQQLVKNSLTGNDRTFDRKLREAALAVQLEQQWCEGRSRSACKDDILEQYLNTIYLGRGAYGVQAGARTWFNLDASELGWAEAAMLAAMIRNPTGYDPLKFPDLARERRGVVVRRLLAVGAIDEAIASLVEVAPIPTQTWVVDAASGDDTLTEIQKRVRDEILKAELPGLERLGGTYALRDRLLFKGGLRVFTTWDQTAQRYADEAVAANPLLRDNPGIATALVAVEPATGAVRAMVGEWRNEDGVPIEVGNPRIGRSPGSSFKTFTLVAALEEDYVLRDSIGTHQVPRKELSGDLAKRPSGWPDGCKSGGSMDLARAISASNNCAFVRLHNVVGDDEVLAVASRMGIDTSDRTETGFQEGAGLGRALGSYAPVRPLQMAAAYGVLANDGRRNPPHFVDRIEDSAGNVLYRYTPPQQQVLEVQTARSANKALKGVVDGGTGSGARIRGWDVAGKTGTNEDGPRKENKDVWFVGYTPEISVAVWSGYPGRQQGIKGWRAQGGKSAAVIFQDFTSRYLADRAESGNKRFEDPEYTRYGKYIKDPWSGRSSRSSSSDRSSSSSSGTRSSTGRGG